MKAGTTFFTVKRNMLMMPQGKIEILKKLILCTTIAQNVTAITAAAGILTLSLLLQTQPCLHMFTTRGKLAPKFSDPKSGPNCICYCLSYGVFLCSMIFDIKILDAD